VTHAQIDPAKRRAMLARLSAPPATKSKRTGRPRVMRDGVATSVYLPAHYVSLIEAYRKRNGIKSKSEAHRAIIDQWAKSDHARGSAEGPSPRERTGRTTGDRRMELSGAPASADAHRA